MLKEPTRDLTDSSCPFATRLVNRRNRDKLKMLSALNSPIIDYSLAPDVAKNVVWYGALQECCEEGSTFLQLFIVLTSGTIELS